MESIQQDAVEQDSFLGALQLFVVRLRNPAGPCKTCNLDVIV